MDKKERECGDCILCCKLLAVEEIAKPVDRWCTKIDLNKLHRRCLEYAIRPLFCRDFKCLWLEGSLALPYKPNLVKVVAALVPVKQGTPMVALFEDIADTARSRFARYIREWVDKDLVVCIIHRGTRRWFLPRGVKLVDVLANLVGPEKQDASPSKE